ncbi:hypothetical protein BC938DRAFT_481296 [Jimgerdemannia flammicorona]|uniref:2'-phosphotransferase n=1 Tax=Jimgerdemannia flammicorona TaxID=994334 RepID=A0A433QH45_9FUNG|nr:hypothetical protein BC938DRAFT_481296 [Jimgerdemannia flammicorona]
MSSSRQQPSNIKLSKAMSWLLRHRAEQEGIPIRPDGFVRVKDMLSHKRFKQYKLADVQREVAINDKQRYALVEEEGNDGEKEWLVRANQGHNALSFRIPTSHPHCRLFKRVPPAQIEAVEMTKINFPAEIPTVIHGTYSAYWPSIEKQGLSKMRRNHIHFAAGMLGDEGVISGESRASEGQFLLRHKFLFFFFLC